MILSLPQNVAESVATALSTIVSATSAALNSVEATLANIFTNLHLLQQNVLQSAIDLLNDQADSAREVVKAIRSALDQYDISIPSLNTLVHEVGDLLDDLPLGISAHIAETLSDIVQTLATAAANPDLSASLGPIITSMQNALAPLADLADLQGNSASFVSDLAAAINEFYTQASAGVTSGPVASLVQQLGTNLQNLVENIGSMATDLADAIQVALSSLVGEAISDFSEAITSGTDDLQTVLSEVSAAASNGLGQFNEVSTAVTTALSAVQTRLSAFTSSLNPFGLQARLTQADLTNLLNSLRTIVSSVNSAIQEATSNILSESTSIVGDAFGALYDFAIAFNSSLYDGATEGGFNPKVVVCMTALPAPVSKAIEAALPVFRTCLVNGFPSVVATAIQSLSDQFEIVSKAIDAIRNCSTAYQANGNALSGAACLLTAAVNVVTVSTSATSATVLTAFTTQVASIAALLPECVSRALVDVNKIIPSFEKCVAGN